MAREFFSGTTIPVCLSIRISPIPPTLVPISRQPDRAASTNVSPKPSEAPPAVSMEGPMNISASERNSGRYRFSIFPLKSTNSSRDKSVVRSLSSSSSSPLPIILSLTSFMIMNYIVSTSLTKVKNKPNQTQTKPIQTQFIQKIKIILNRYDKMNYENFSANMGKKTNPNKANFYTIGCMQTKSNNWKLMQFGQTR